MKVALIAILLLTTGIAVVAAAPTASAGCIINMNGDPLHDVEYCNATVWDVACVQSHVCL